MRNTEPVGVGICYAGPYSGSWIMGPAESSIEAAFDEADDQVYSWSWEFQPFQSEYDLPRALTRRQALSQVREWRVEWVDRSLASLAGAMLFDEGGFEERRTLFGLIKSVTLVPIDGVNLLSRIRPLKLQSVRSALTFKMQVEETFPQLMGRRAPEWSHLAAELLRGDFIEVDRQGAFAGEEELREDARNASRSPQSSASPLQGELVSRARELARTRRCVAFLPEGRSVLNDYLPTEPWAWLRGLQG